MYTKKIALKYELIECFKKYEKCINSHLDEKIKLSGKSMLYAYIEACGLETKIEKIIAKAEFQKIFNLGDEYLMPLKEFLKSHIKE